MYPKPKKPYPSRQTKFSGWQHLGTSMVRCSSRSDADFAASRFVLKQPQISLTLSLSLPLSLSQSLSLSFSPPFIPDDCMQEPYHSPYRTPLAVWEPLKNPDNL